MVEYADLQKAKTLRYKNKKESQHFERLEYDTLFMDTIKLKLRELLIKSIDNSIDKATKNSKNIAYFNLNECKQTIIDFHLVHLYKKTNYYHENKSTNRSGRVSLLTMLKSKENDFDYYDRKMLDGILIDFSLHFIIQIKYELINSAWFAWSSFLNMEYYFQDAGYKLTVDTNRIQFEYK